MSILKYAAGIPAVAAVVATMYGGLSYVNGLQSTIEQNEKQITQIENDIKNNKVEITSRVTAIDEKTKDKITAQFEKVNIRLDGVDAMYKQSREELLLEMTEFAGRIARVDAVVQALRNSTHELASEAEMRGLEQSYYKLNDALNQLKYDIKELDRKFNGGY